MGWRAGLIVGAVGMAALAGVAGMIKWSTSPHIDTDRVSSLHDEGMPSKHDKCRVDTFGGSKKALPDGTYANYWCTGSVRCTRGLNAEEIKCADGETYGNDGCVEKTDEDEKMCA